MVNCCYVGQTLVKKFLCYLRILRDNAVDDKHFFTSTYDKPIGMQIINVSEKVRTLLVSTHLSTYLIKITRVYKSTNKRTC